MLDEKEEERLVKDVNKLWYEENTKVVNGGNMGGERGVLWLWEYATG